MTAPSGAELCPLSFGQQRLWFLDQLQPGNPVYNIAQAWRLDGPLDANAFARAVRALADRHEALRTTFAKAGGQPVQIVSPEGPVDLATIDLSRDTDPAQTAERILRESARQAFDLARGPLFRVRLLRLDEGSHIALFSLHHIIADAWSFQILRRELGAFYEAFCDGAEPQLPELPIQYLDYAHWQRRQATGERLRRDLQFWKNHLAGDIPPLDLPADHSRGAAPECDGASASFELSPETTASLRELGRIGGATLFMVLTAAFKAFLHRITGREDILIGTPVSARDRVETEAVIGLFVNTLVLRTDLSGDPTFPELLARVRDTTLAALAHQEFPFEELVRVLQPERAPGQNPLFQVVLALHNGFPRQWHLGGVRATLMDVDIKTAKFDWTFLLEETDCGIQGRLEYKTDLFEADTILRFLRHFQVLIEGIVANPHRRLSELPLLTAAERRQLLIDWNQTTTNYERDACIHEVFEARAEAAPDTVALVFGEESMTYGELNRRANQLARRLKQSGVAPDTLVGLNLERSPEMIVAMLGILKAGGAYVPLDRACPSERLANLLKDSGVSLLLSDSAFHIPPGERAPEIIRVDVERDRLAREPEANQFSGAGPDHLAYVMYTSGSTGMPKGVTISHRAVVRLVRNTNYARFSPKDVFLQLAPASFDASTFEIWGCLLNGARLVIFPPHVPSLEELGEIIQRHAVTTLWLTAGLFDQMVDHQLASLKSVRQLLAGGDVLSPAHVLKALRGLPGCQLINGYGPTENTTFTCCHRIPSDWNGAGPVPIGRPISNTRVYVLDKNLAPVPIGVPGELYAAGDGLARGYLNQPALTGEKFISSPFNGSAPPGRLYRTGDSVRWLPDGTLEFLGRKDQQVKIRGFRVEPGEVEALLAQHPSVSAAVVVARGNSPAERHLVACVVFAAEKRCEAAALREFLEAKLPAWMLPAHFVELARVPLTANGKVDRRALPAPETDGAANGQAVTPPGTPLEEKLMDIWREVLNRNAFGVHDNFFHLGGHSLLAAAMVSRIARVLHIEVPLSAVFEAPTIAALAERIGAAPRGRAAEQGAVIGRRIQGAHARRLLARINELSEDEVEALLETTRELPTRS